jgi:transcriptional regulator GlxA family with amidase domain
MDRRVQTVIALMRNNLEYELPLSELVRVVNLSPSHLQRLFKAELGITTFRYMKLLRMERARYLLESSFLSVKEIMKTVMVCSAPANWRTRFPQRLQWTTSTICFPEVQAPGNY